MVYGFHCKSSHILQLCFSKRIVLHVLVRKQIVADRNHCSFLIVGWRLQFLTAFADWQGWRQLRPLPALQRYCWLLRECRKPLLPALECRNFPLKKGKGKQKLHYRGLPNHGCQYIPDRINVLLYLLYLLAGGVRQYVPLLSPQWVTGVLLQMLSGKVNRPSACVPRFFLGSVFPKKNRKPSCGIYFWMIFSSSVSFLRKCVLYPL